MSNVRNIKHGACKLSPGSSWRLITENKDHDFHESPRIHDLEEIL